MEQWLKEAKESARYDAEEFLSTLRISAQVLRVDEDWYIDEALIYLKKLRKENDNGNE